MLGFLQVLKPIKLHDLLEEGKNGCNVFWTSAKIHFTEKQYLELKDPFLWLVDFVIF